MKHPTKRQIRSTLFVIVMTFCVVPVLLVPFEPPAIAELPDNENPINPHDITFPILGDNSLSVMKTIVADPEIWGDLSDKDFELGLTNVLSGNTLAFVPGPDSLMGSSTIYFGEYDGSAYVNEAGQVIYPIEDALDELMADPILGLESTPTLAGITTRLYINEYSMANVIRIPSGSYRLLEVDGPDCSASYFNCGVYPPLPTDIVVFDEENSNVMMEIVNTFQMNQEEDEERESNGETETVGQPPPTSKPPTPLPNPKHPDKDSTTPKPPVAKIKSPVKKSKASVQPKLALEQEARFLPQTGDTFRFGLLLVVLVVSGASSVYLFKRSMTNKAGDLVADKLRDDELQDRGRGK